LFTLSGEFQLPKKLWDNTKTAFGVISGLPLPLLL